MARVWKTGRRKPENIPRVWHKRELENKTSNETRSAKKPRGSLQRLGLYKEVLLCSCPWIILGVLT